MDVADLRRRIHQGRTAPGRSAGRAPRPVREVAGPGVEARLTDPTAMVVGPWMPMASPGSVPCCSKHYDAEGWSLHQHGQPQGAPAGRQTRVSVCSSPGTIPGSSGAYVTGRVEKIGTLEVMKYFHSRPKGQSDSRLGFPGSRPASLSARGVLEVSSSNSSRSLPMARCRCRKSFWGWFPGADRDGGVLAGVSIRPA